MREKCCGQCYACLIAFNTGSEVRVRLRELFRGHNAERRQLAHPDKVPAGAEGAIRWWYDNDRGQAQPSR